MIAKVNINLGKTSIQFEFDNAEEMEAMHRAIAVSTYPTNCNICKKEALESELKLTTNKDSKGNIYVNLKHIPCTGTVKLGQFKQGGYFWHREFEVYNKGGQTNEQK